MKRTLAVATILSVSLVIGGCSSDDADTDSATADPANTTRDAGADEASGESEADAARGTVTVAGETITFTPSAVCLIGPDGVAFGGPGTTESGDPAYVDSGDRNQLHVYLGTDDPFEAGTAQYEHADPMRELGQLKVNGSALTAQPTMVRSDDGSLDPAGTATVSVSCE